MTLETIRNEKALIEAVARVNPLDAEEKKSFLKLRVEAFFASYPDLPEFRKQILKEEVFT